ESVTEPVEENSLDVTATREVSEMSAACDTAPVVDAIDTLAEEDQVDSSVNPEFLPVVSEEVEVVKESSVSLEPTVTSSDVVIEPISLPEEAAVPEIIENTPAVEVSSIEVSAESSDETFPVPTEFASQEVPEVIPTDDSELVASQEPRELPVTDVCPLEETQSATGNPDVTQCSVDAEPSSEEVADEFDNNDVVVAESTEVPEGSTNPAEESSTTENAVVNVPAVEENCDAEIVDEAVPAEATEESVNIVPGVVTADADVSVEASQDQLSETAAELKPEADDVAQEAVDEETLPVVGVTEVHQSVEDLVVSPEDGDQVEVISAEDDSEVSEKVVIAGTPSEEVDEGVEDNDLCAVESTILSKESPKTVHSVVDVPSMEGQANDLTVDDAILTEVIDESVGAVAEVATAEAHVLFQESQAKPIEAAAEVTSEKESLVLEFVEVETVAPVVNDANSPVVVKEVPEELQLIEDLIVEPVNGDQVEISTSEEPSVVSEVIITETPFEDIIEAVDKKNLVVAESVDKPVESTELVEEPLVTVERVVEIPVEEDNTSIEVIIETVTTGAILESAVALPKAVTVDTEIPVEESQNDLAERTSEADVVKDNSTLVTKSTKVAQPVEDLVVQAANDDQVKVSPAEAVAVVTKEGIVTETHFEQVVEVVDKKDLVIAESVDTHVESTESAEESSKIVESVVPAVEDDRSTETMDDAVPADATEETIAALPEDMVAEGNDFVESSEVTVELTPEAEVVVAETVVETVPVMVDDAISPVVIEEVPEEPQLIEDLVVEPVNGDQAEISTSEEASVVSQEVVLTETLSEVVAKDGGCKDLVVAESNETPAGSTELAANSAKPIDAVQPAVENIANTEAMDEVVPTTASEEPIATVPEVVTVSEADDTVENSEDEPVEAVVEESSETVKEEAMSVVMEGTTLTVFMEETPAVPHSYSESATELVEENPLNIAATKEVSEMSAVCDTAPVVDAIDTLAEESHVDSSVNFELLPVASDEVEAVEESVVSLEPMVTSSDVVIEPISLHEEAAVPVIIENTPAVEVSSIEASAESSDETLPVPTEFASQEVPEVIPTDDSERVGSEVPEGLPVTDISPDEGPKPATGNPGVTRCSIDADHSSEEVVDDLVNIDLVVAESTGTPARSTDSAEKSSTTDNAAVDVSTMEDPANNETVVEVVTAVTAEDPVGAVPGVVVAEADVAVEYVQDEPTEAPVELTPEAKTVVPETVPLAVEVTSSPVLAEEASEVPQPVDDLVVEPVYGDQLEISALEGDSEVSAGVVATETPVNVVQVEFAENPEQMSPTSEEVEVAVDPSNFVEITALPSDAVVGTADKPEEVSVPEIVEEQDADGSVDKATVSTALENALQKSSSYVEPVLSTSIESKESEVVSSTEVNPTEDLQPVMVETLSETVIDDIVDRDSVVVKPDEALEELSELAEKSPEVIDLISEVEPVVEDQPNARIVRQVAPINTTDAAVDIEAKLSPPVDCITLGKAQTETAKSIENLDESRSVVEAAGFATTCTDLEEHNTSSSDAITEPIEGFVEPATPEVAEHALAADSISNSATSNPTDEPPVTASGIDSVETAKAVPVKHIMTECEETMDAPAIEGSQTDEPQSIAKKDESILDPVFGENSSDVVDDIVADENVVSAEPRICPLSCDDQSTQVERSTQAQLSSEVIDSATEAEPVEENHPVVQPVNEIHTAVVTGETHTAAPEELLSSNHIAVRAEAEETSGNTEYLDINSAVIGNGQEREPSIGSMDSEIVAMTEAIPTTHTVMETVSIVEPETLQPKESEVAAIVSPEVSSTYPETEVDESHFLSLTECEQPFDDEAEAERTSVISGIEPAVDSLVSEVSTVVGVDKCTTELIAEVIHTAVDPPPTSEASVPTENVETREVRDFNDGADQVNPQDLVEEEQDLTLDPTPDVNKYETVEDATRSESEVAVVTEQSDNQVIESHSLVNTTVNEVCSNTAAVKTVSPCTIQTNDVTEETKPSTEATSEVESAISMEPTVMVDDVKPDNDVKDGAPCEVEPSATEAESDFVMVETPSNHGVEECAKDKEVATDNDSTCPPCVIAEPDATPADQAESESPLEEQGVPLDKDSGDKPTEDAAELPRFNEQVVNETIQPAAADEPLQELTDALSILDSELPTEAPTVPDELLQESVKMESPVASESQPETVPSECDIEHTSDAVPETPYAVEVSAPAPVPTSTEVSENSTANDQSPVIVTPVTTYFPVDEIFMSSYEKTDTAPVVGKPPKISDTEATTAETGERVHDVGGDHNSSPSVTADVALSRDAPAESHEIFDNTENALCSEQSLHELEFVKPLDTTPTAPDEPESTALWEENQSSVVSSTADVTIISIEKPAVVTAPEETETEERSVALPPADDESSELPAVADQVKESSVESLQQSAANHTVTSEVNEDDLPRDAEESEPLVDVGPASSTSAVPITTDVSSDLPNSFAASDTCVVEPADQESAAVAETVNVKEPIVSKDTTQPGKDEIGNVDSSTVIVPADAVEVSSLTEEILLTPALSLPSFEGEEVNAIMVEEPPVVHIVHKDEALIAEHSDVQRDSEVTSVEEKIAIMAVDQETLETEVRIATAVDEQPKEAAPTTDTSKLYEADDHDGQESVASFTTADEGHDDKHHMDSLELDEDRPIPFPSPSRDSTDSAVDVNESEDEPSKANASAVDVIEAPTEGDLATATQTPEISKAPSISSKISKRRRRRSSVWKRLKGWFTG
ncbi:hypothetical protein IWQ61_008914, partial [Dispira simplex]